MAALDLESLLKPIRPDAPAGDDLEYDPTYAEMEQAAAGKPEQQMGNAVIEGEEPDWKLVRNSATELLLRTKDLRVCAHLCRASTGLDGLSGLADSLRLIDGIVTTFWGSLYPQLDPDDDNDPTARVNAVMALASPSFIRSVEKLPLLSLPVLGSVSWNDIKPKPNEASGQAAGGAVLAIVNQSKPDVVAAQHQAAAAAHQASLSIERFITQQVGAASAPNLEPLQELLKKIESQLGKWAESRKPKEEALPADEPERSDDAGDKAAAGLAATGPSGATAVRRRAVPSGGGFSGSVGSREEVLVAIDAILDYYRECEPSSPLPLLLMRARRLAGLSFMEILQDICPEGLPRARSLVGDGAMPPSSSARLSSGTGSSASGLISASTAGAIPDFEAEPPSEPAPPEPQSAPADDFF
jgi:type VI secretion system protein ImpA